MTGHDHRIDGDAGEGLFQYLACYGWRAEVLRHPEGQGTDAYIGWHDLAGTDRLPIQVKTRNAVSVSSHSIALKLRPSEIRGWAARRPILVLCDLSAARAWWCDTRNLYIPSEPRVPVTLRFALSNPVDATTRDTIRRVAVERWRSSVGYPRLPSRLRNLRRDRVESVVRDAYAEIDGVQGHDRDVIAMATTRFVQRYRRPDLLMRLDFVISPMIQRIDSKDQGGRSHSLTALLAIILPTETRAELRTDLGPELADIAEYAATSRDFVHPEFGLLVAARLAETGDARCFEHFHWLLNRAAELERTERFHAVIRKLVQWKPGSVPLRQLFGRKGTNAELVRWSDSSVDVFNRQDEATEAVARAIQSGAASLNATELALIDHWTRYRADRYLEHDLGRTLFSDARRNRS